MSFDLTVARRCLQASADAYAGGTVETSLAHVLIVEGSEEVIVAFRGTANIRDWITDLDCLMGIENRDQKAKAGNGAEVHIGFLRAVTSVFDPLLQILQAHDGMPVVITGHSLGGALATLCAKALAGKAKVEERPNPIAAVYTFGQPRIGNSVFAKNYDAVLGERTWRFVNEEDIVPRVPGLIAGYRHAGQEVFLTSPGSGLTVNPSIWVKLISDAVGLYQEWKQGRVALLADHFVQAYQARIPRPLMEEAKL